MNLNKRAYVGVIAMLLLLLSGVIGIAVFFSTEHEVFKAEELEPSSGLDLTDEVKPVHFTPHHLDWISVRVSSPEMFDNSVHRKLDNQIIHLQCQEPAGKQHHFSEFANNTKSFSFTLQRCHFAVDGDEGNQIYTVTYEAFYGIINANIAHDAAEMTLGAQVQPPAGEHWDAGHNRNGLFSRFMKRRRADAGA